MGNITIDVIDNAFVLSGGTDAILRSRWAKRRFAAIGASFEESGKILLRFDEGAMGRCYGDIKRVLSRHKIEWEPTPVAEDRLEKVDQLERNFDEFSRKAKAIRDNDHQEGEFEHFVKVVDTQIQRELYPRQLLSAYHLAFAQNACNFSVPGAGKTTIVYAAYAYLQSLAANDSKHVGRILIICPRSAFGPWEDEYKKCFGTTPVIKKLVGVNPKERRAHFLGSNQDTEITLISYQSASSDAEHIKEYLQRCEDVMVVLDEAHKIKNTSEEAVWAKAIQFIAEDAKARVVLTGTPAPNGYQDLWNLYKFIWPDRDIIGFPLRYLSNLSKPDDKEQLIEEISPFFIRITKLHLDLPEPKFHNPISVPMEADQQMIYNHIEKKYIDYFESHMEHGPFAELRKAKLIRLRQCLTNPALLNKPIRNYEGYNEIGTDDRVVLQAIQNYQSIPNKFIEIKNLLEQIIKNDGPAGKAVVWAYFIDNIHALASYLHTKGVKCEKLYGDVPTEGEDTEENEVTREKIVSDFGREDCPYKVIIANPLVVGESISLHEACHNAIYLEKDFNATIYMQSKDRTHRYGLGDDDVVNYYYLITENSIDQTIHDRVLEKEQRMLEIIEKEDDIPLLTGYMDDMVENDIKRVIDDYHARHSAQ